MKKILYLICVLLILMTITYLALTKMDLNLKYDVGDPIDSLDGVTVFYNGGIDNVTERNETKDGYNIGLSYQCVEFIKRYYLEHYKHKMPNSYGNAKNFFDKSLKDGQYNENRGLYQYTNGSMSLPQKGDILVYDSSLFNWYGHASIVSTVNKQAMELEVIQQNAGPFSSPRNKFSIDKKDNKIYIHNSHILGWLSLH